MQGKTREGLVYGLACYGLWGLVPLYFCLLKEIDAVELLLHRVLWSALFLGILVAVSGRWDTVRRSFCTPSLLLPLTIPAVLIAANWLVYIISVNQERIAEASLGYYVTPLVSVLIGLAAYRERLRPLQWLAIGVAGLGVALMVRAIGGVPWIALILAVSFGLYGAIRKKVPVDGLAGLSVETCLLVPAGIIYLVWAARDASLQVGMDQPGLFALVALSGVVTAIPLLCFGQAARRLPLSTLGFLQYLAPTLQLGVAVYVFDERPTLGWWNFALIWVALGIFSADALLAQRKPGLSNDPRLLAAEPQAAE